MLYQPRDRGRTPLVAQIRTGHGQPRSRDSSGGVRQSSKDVQVHSSSVSLHQPSGLHFRTRRQKLRSCSVCRGGR